MTATHALVIGKFYPPHAGHHLLIRTAAAQCERVTVIVMAASHESIPMTTRMDWLREVHQKDPGVLVTGIVDDVRIDYEDAAVWSEHVALMQQALAQVQAPPVTAVFTSEPYGVELARRLGAVAVTLDLTRSLVPISSTRVRASITDCWDQLAAPVRGSLALKVAVIGAESTGTTTLSMALAHHFWLRGGAFGLTRGVGEYGREYSVQKYASAIANAQLHGKTAPGFEELHWHSEEFVHIAGVQLARQEAEARLGGPVLVCDTDAFATGIWHERYMGSNCEELDQIAGNCRADLYLVTDHKGVTFVQDGLRDGEAIRGWMTQRFVEALKATGRSFTVLEGSHEQRLATSVVAVDALLARSWRFTPPLG